MTSGLFPSLDSLHSLLEWAPYSPERAATLSPQQIKLPDLLTAFPGAARDFRINALCKEITESSNEWARKEVGVSPSSVTKRELAGEIPLHATQGRLKTERELEGEKVDLKTGLLTSMCFPTTDRSQIRLCADFLAWTWLLHHYPTGCNPNAAKDCIEESIRLIENEPGYTEICEPGFPEGLQDILKRLERSPESRYTYDRFKGAIHDHLKLLLLHQHSEYYEAGASRSLKKFLACRREAGWHVPLFILIEAAHGLESIAVDQRMQSHVKPFRDTAAEVIIYALDIYEFAACLAQTGTYRFPAHNCVTVLAQEQKIDATRAIERAGELCADRLRAFSALQASLQKKNSGFVDSRTNADVEIFVRGLGDCIRGALHWVFESERYFGQDGAYVRMTLTIEPATTGSESQEEMVEE